MAIFTGPCFHDSEAAYTAIGTTIPPCAGDYSLTGQHNGQSYYTHTDETWLLWWTGTRYALSHALDVTEPGYWRQTAGGPPPSYYQPMGTYENWMRLFVYEPAPMDRQLTPVMQKGGGSSLRIRRLRPNTRPTERQLKAMSAFTRVSRCWDLSMQPALQAEWLHNFIDWDTYYGVTNLEKSYPRFMNVNMTLANSEEPLIFMHTGRGFLDVQWVAIDTARYSTQEITTWTSVRQNFTNPCYTLLSFFQVWCLAAGGPRKHWHKRLLGVAEAFALPFQQDPTIMIHKWPAFYPLETGDWIQIVLRITCDNDHPDGGPWAPFTIMQVSDTIPVIF